MTPAFIASPSSNGFSAGPVFIHAYGLVYVLGVTAAVLVTRRRWERQGGSGELVLRCRDVGLPGGSDRGSPVPPRDELERGAAPLVGAVGDLEGRPGDLGRDRAGAAVGLWRLRRAGVNMPAFMDAAAPGLLVAQAIGRIGNYFNQELFGGPTTLPWALEIDPAHRPAGYERYTTFHPTFLYELIFDLALAAV